tara:strand:- start:11469 stop:11651 length:183 start_codon:yes stop_codon:yes gene_type:complete
MVEVKVTIHEDGSVETEVNGVKGTGCKQYTDAVIKALGGEVLKEELKPSYYETDSNSVKN